MKLSNLPSSSSKKKKRVGRGYGSGRGGHTSGRGSKGQKARSKVRLYFEGGQLPLVRRLPHLPGFTRKKKKPEIVNISELGIFSAGSVITPESLKDKGLIGKSAKQVKILGKGTIDKKLTVKGCVLSKGAQKKIKEAGGELRD